MTIKIFIDQGHNPSLINAGANAGDTQEADVTFIVGRFLAELLNNDVRFEAKVSRPSADTVLGTTIRESLQARVDLANEWNADYFISIHANANTNSNIQGAEVYLYQNNEESEALAQNILDGLHEVTNVKDNGVRFNPSLFVNLLFYIFCKIFLIFQCLWFFITYSHKHTSVWFLNHL